MFRARIVFNAPVDRQHAFYSTAKRTLDEAVEVVRDMKPAIVHAVSVQIQQTSDPEANRGWETLPPSTWTVV